jgi:hypothetical protein
MKNKLCSIALAGAIVLGWAFFATACGEKDENGGAATPALSVTPTTIAVDQVGGTYDIAVTGNVDWVAAVSDLAATLSKRSGNGNETIKVTVVENTGVTPRTITVTVTDKAKGVPDQVVTLTQFGTAPAIIATPASGTVAAAGGELSLSLAANTDWVANSSDSWLQPDPGMGISSDVVTITVDPSYSTSVRTATVTFSAAAPDISAEFAYTVTQDALVPVLGVSQNVFEVSAATATTTVNIDANLPWTITNSADAGWVTLSQTTGTGPAYLTITTTEHEGTTDRIATLTVNVDAMYGLEPATITITQRVPYFNAPTIPNPLTLHGDGQDYTWWDPTYNGGTQPRTPFEWEKPATFTISSNIPWTATTSGTWLTAENYNDTLRIVATTNFWADARTGSVILSYKGDTKATVNVSQSGRETVHITGGMVSNWNEYLAVPMVNEGGGIFTYEGTLKGGSNGAFKFPLNNHWPAPILRPSTGDGATVNRGEEVDVAGAGRHESVGATHANWNPTGTNLDWKWSLSTSGYSKITLNLNTKKLKIETATPSDPNAVLINGVLWAKYNVDDNGTFASTPEALGKFFQFQYNTAYSATDPVTPAWSVPTYTGADNTYWYTATMPCPSGWSVPDEAVLKDLIIDGYSWAEAGSAKGNTVAGGFFGTDYATATISNMGEAIFIPAAGARYANGTLHEAGTAGYVHSWNPMWAETSQMMRFDSEGAAVIALRNNETGWENYELGAGAAVRCVKK